MHPAKYNGASTRDKIKRLNQAHAYYCAMLDGEGRRSNLQEALRAIIETALGRSCFRAWASILRRLWARIPSWHSWKGLEVEASPIYWWFTSSMTSSTSSTDPYRLKLSCILPLKSLMKPFVTLMVEASLTSSILSSQRIRFIAPVSSAIRASLSLCSFWFVSSCF